jgi:signal transduction histidine kinase
MWVRPRSLWPPAFRKATYTLGQQDALRISQEALQNAAKHAHAQTVELTLEQQESELILRVKDDGRGFNPKRTFPGHLGLHSKRERMAGVGGNLEIQSSRGRGTSIHARIPVADSVDRPL